MGKKKELRDEVKKLRKALKPFARIAREFPDSKDADNIVFPIEMGDLRRAEAARQRRRRD